MSEVSKAKSLKVWCIFWRDLLENLILCLTPKMLIWCAHLPRRWLICSSADWYLAYLRAAAPHWKLRNNNQMLSFLRTFLPKKIKPLALCYLNYLQSNWACFYLYYQRGRCDRERARLRLEDLLWVLLLPCRFLPSLYCSFSVGKEYLPCRAITVVEWHGTCK